MLLSTTDTIAGEKIIEHKGLVHTSESFSFRPDPSQDDADARTLDVARQNAIERLILAASALGANAVVGVRFSTAQFNNFAMNEVIVYGTAVVVEQTTR